MKWLQLIEELLKLIGQLVSHPPATSSAVSRENMRSAAMTLRQLADRIDQENK